jgi:hypothetical protein
MFSIMAYVTCGMLETSFQPFFVTSKYKKCIRIKIQELCLCIRR